MRPGGTTVVRTAVKRLLVLVVLAGCEKTGPVDETPGLSNSTPPAGPPPIVVDAGITTLQNEAKAAENARKAEAERKRVEERERQAREERARRAADQAAMDRMVAQLTAIEPKGTIGSMENRRPGTDLGRNIDAGPSGVVVGRGGGTAGVGTGPRIDSPGSSATVPGTVSVGGASSTSSETTLTTSAVVAKISSAYLAGVKRCYKKQLATEPTLRGKLALKVAVDETGRAGSSSAAGFSTAISECITSMMTSWRFPVPKDKDGNPTTASFEVSLSMTPE